MQLQMMPPNRCPSSVCVPRICLGVFVRMRAVCVCACIVVITTKFVCNLSAARPFGYAALFMAIDHVVLAALAPLLLLPFAVVVFMLWSFPFLFQLLLMLLLLLLWPLHALSSDCPQLLIVAAGATRAPAWRTLRFAP